MKRDLSMHSEEYNEDKVKVKDKVVDLMYLVEDDKSIGQDYLLYITNLHGNAQYSILSTYVYRMTCNELSQLESRKKRPLDKERAEKIEKLIKELDVLNWKDKYINVGNEDRTTTLRIKTQKAKYKKSAINAHNDSMHKEFEETISFLFRKEIRDEINEDGMPIFDTYDKISGYNCIEAAKIYESGKGIKEPNIEKANEMWLKTGLPNRVGNVFYRQNDYKKALEYYQKYYQRVIVSLLPDEKISYKSIKNMIKILCEEEKDTEKALEVVDKISSIDDRFKTLKVEILFNYVKDNKKVLEIIKNGMLRHERNVKLIEENEEYLIKKISMGAVVSFSEIYRQIIKKLMDLEKYQNGLDLPYLFDEICETVDFYVEGLKPNERVYYSLMLKHMNRKLVFNYLKAYILCLFTFRTERGCTDNVNSLLNILVEEKYSFRIARSYLKEGHPASKIINEIYEHSQDEAIASYIVANIILLVERLKKDNLDLSYISSIEDVDKYVDRILSFPIYY